MGHRLIIASNRLPINIYEADGSLGISRSNGGLATALASLFNQDSSIWVGWTGFRRRLFSQELNDLALPEYLLPINLTKQEIAHYYDGFSNGIAWPLAHGLTPTVPYQPALWRAVRSVTERFTDAISSTIQPGDTVWIHDYHLFLLPAALRKRGITNRIGFFLHTPFFPTTKLSSLPHVTEILRSLECADIIGVQTNRDVRRFHQALKNLKIPHHTAIRAFPIGIDADEFASLALSTPISTLVQDIQPRLYGRRCIFSLSRLDYTKGILTQLKAFERLISDPSFHSTVMYRLNVAPSRESVPEYRSLRLAIEELVDMINARFGTPAWQPVWYSYDNMGPEEITAWYLLGDVHLNTPVADGMNLIAKEYVAARQRPGVLIISGTMGAARQLGDAIIVPPRNVAAIARALENALAMSSSAKSASWKQLRAEVFAHQASDWAKDFLAALVKK